MDRLIEKIEEVRKVFLLEFVSAVLYDTDKEIIAYIEANKERFGTTEIFRAAMEALIKNGGI